MDGWESKMTAIKRGRHNRLTLQQIASYGHQILTVREYIELSHLFTLYTVGNEVFVWTGVSPSWTYAHWEHLCGGGHVSTRGI